MSQDHKSGLFASFYGSKGKRKEEELEAERESRQKLEDRIRQVLVIADTPSPIMPETPDRRPANSTPIFGL